ncbi:MAG: hypothetical protein K9M54_06925 [Kiritimatiellales bacterium]|nr:hypothetical protein [Kiritimatiellales bacterium]
MAASSGWAAVVTFTGASGVDSNFSTAANWSSGTVPLAGDTAYVAAFKTLIVDGVYTVGNFRANALSGTNNGMSYVEIVSGAALSDGSITVGNASASYNGTLTLRSGGATHTTANNGGVLSIGGTSAGMIGNMVVEAGAVFEQSRLTLNTYGTLDFVFGADSVSTFTAKKTTTGNDNVMDGMLEVDLGALATAGTYTLINSASTNLVIGGALRTWLDGNGGSVSGSGSYVGSNFTVSNGDGKDWTLSLADNNQDLTLTVAVFPLNHIGSWESFWRGEPVIGEWLASGQGIEEVHDYQRKNSFAYQTRPLGKEIQYADHLNVVRLIGGWRENAGVEKPVPADVADLVYKDGAGILQYRWDKLAGRLDPYIGAGYTNLTLVLDNIPYCFVETPFISWTGQVAAPVNFVEWQTFVSNLCVQLVNLYGFETANQFRFRQGTEASGTDRFHGTQEDYFKIYDYSATAVKSVLPGAKFGPFNQAGGKDDPASLNVNILALAQHCVSGINHATGTVGTPFDFIAISDYIALPTHAHNPQAAAAGLISFFNSVQALLPDPVPWEAHEFGILTCESNLSTGEPGARGAAWYFHMMSRLREAGLARWYHWGVFDTFRSNKGGLHKLLTSHGWLLAVLDRTVGGKAVVLEQGPPANPQTQARTLAVYGGGRDWILTGVFNPDRLSHTPETVTIRVPRNIISVDEGDRILWTSLNQTNAVHSMIRRDLEEAGMLNAAFAAVPEQLASIRTMTTNSTLSAEQEFLAARLPLYEQAIMDSLTLKPFPGTVATNFGELVFTVTLTPPETAVICIGPDQTSSGIPYQWLDAQGLATNGYEQAAQTDHDGDGMATGDEYLAGTDPLLASSVFNVRMQADQLSWDAVSNRTYLIWSATNLLGEWSVLGTYSSDSSQPVVFPLNDSDAIQFFRLQTGPGL